MAENLKNLCAHIPIELHNKVREKQQASGKTLNEYVAELIAEFYAIKENEGGTNMSGTRTLAVQMPAELFDRLDEYVTAHKMKKKEFVINLIRKALDDAEAVQTVGETASESSDEETGDEPVPG